MFCSPVIQLLENFNRILSRLTWISPEHDKTAVASTSWAFKSSCSVGESSRSYGGVSWWDFGRSYDHGGRNHFRKRDRQRATGHKHAVDTHFLICTGFFSWTKSWSQSISSSTIIWLLHSCSEYDPRPISLLPFVEIKRIGHHWGMSKHRRFVLGLEY